MFWARLDVRASNLCEHPNPPPVMETTNGKSAIVNPPQIHNKRTRSTVRVRTPQRPVLARLAVSQRNGYFCWTDTSIKKVQKKRNPPPPGPITLPVWPFKALL